LAAELQRGTLPQEEFERAYREVEHRIVAEHGGGAPAVAAHRPAFAAALAVGLLLPLAVVLGYMQLGEPRALNVEPAQQADPKQMAALVERLSAHLRKPRRTCKAGTLLARARSALGQYEPAMQAYARALQLTPENRDLLVELVKTLALAGRAAYEAKNYAGAIDYWERSCPSRRRIPNSRAPYPKALPRRASWRESRRRRPPPCRAP
jgi:cytochrome c-type biogenesis protein CcmH